MDVTFYSGFSKRVNSTKRPSGGTTISVILKEPCDLHAPVIKVQGTAGHYNYFKMGDSYFYITSEVVFPSNWVEYTGSLDAMATCADDIKGTTAFVSRCSSGSVKMIDNYAPADTDNQIVKEAESLIFPFSATGTYVVTLSNSPVPVAMSLSQISSLYERLNSEDIVEQIENFFCDFSNYVTGCVWIPYALPTGGTISLKAGKVDLGLSANHISNEITTKTVTLDIGLDDTSLWSSQYAGIKLYLPHCGTVNLSIDDFRTTGKVQILATRDNITGGVLYYISDGSLYSSVATFSGSCAIPMPIGGTSYNIGALGGGIASAIVGAATGNPVALLGGITTAFMGLQSTSQAGGGNGGTRTDIYSAVLTVFQRSAPEPLTNKSRVVGLPTMRTMSLGSVSGFVQCINASIQSAAEMDAVIACNDYLNNGAWIE